MKNDQWLKNQCNRYVNGQCTSLSCLTRGGYQKDKKNNPLPIDFNLSSCEAHEILLELDFMRNKRDVNI